MDNVSSFRLVVTQPAIKACPSCHGKVTFGCMLCAGQGRLAVEQCACGRPNLFTHYQTGVGFCGNGVCVPKRFTIAEKPLTLTQAEIDDERDREEWMMQYGGPGFRPGGHRHMDRRI